MVLPSRKPPRRFSKIKCFFRYLGFGLVSHWHQEEMRTLAHAWYWSVSCVLICRGRTSQEWVTCSTIICEMAMSWIVVKLSQPKRTNGETERNGAGNPSHNKTCWGFTLTFSALKEVRARVDLGSEEGNEFLLQILGRYHSYLNYCLGQHFPKFIVYVKTWIKGNIVLAYKSPGSNWIGQGRRNMDSII